MFISRSGNQELEKIKNNNDTTDSACHKHAKPHFVKCERKHKIHVKKKKLLYISTYHQLCTSLHTTTPRKQRARRQTRTGDNILIITRSEHVPRFLFFRLILPFCNVAFTCFRTWNGEMGKKELGLQFVRTFVMMNLNRISDCVCVCFFLCWTLDTDLCVCPCELRMCNKQCKIH